MSCGLDADELTQLRTDFTSLVCDTACSIARATYVADGEGSSSGTPTTVATTTVGLEPPTATEAQAYAGLIGSHIAWMVKLPYGTDVRSGDHLIFSDATLIVQANLSLQSTRIFERVLAVSIG